MWVTAKQSLRMAGVQNESFIAQSYLIFLTDTALPLEHMLHSRDRPRRLLSIRKHLLPCPEASLRWVYLDLHQRFCWYEFKWTQEDDWIISAAADNLQGSTTLRLAITFQTALSANQAIAIILDLVQSPSPALQRWQNCFYIFCRQLHGLFSHCFQDDNIMRSLQLFENVM